MSIMTGINYFRQMIDVSFDISNIVYTDDVNLKGIFDISRDGFTKNVFQNSDELAINFLPSANIQQGDVLSFNGNIPYSLNVLQIPLLIKYRYNMGLVDLWTAGGFVINYLQVHVKDLPVEIRKGIELVSTDLNYKPIFDRKVLPNMSFSGGADFQLYRNVSFYVGIYTFNFNNDYLRYNTGLKYMF